MSSFLAKCKTYRLVTTQRVPERFQTSIELHQVTVRHENRQKQNQKQIVIKKVESINDSLRVRNYVQLQILSNPEQKGCSVLADLGQLHNDIKRSLDRAVYGHNDTKNPKKTRCTGALSNDKMKSTPKDYVNYQSQLFGQEPKDAVFTPLNMMRTTPKIQYKQMMAPVNLKSNDINNSRRCFQSKNGVLFSTAKLAVPETVHKNDTDKQSKDEVIFHYDNIQRHKQFGQSPIPESQHCNKPQSFESGMDEMKYFDENGLFICSMKITDTISQKRLMIDKGIINKFSEEGNSQIINTSHKKNTELMKLLSKIFDESCKNVLIGNETDEGLKKNNSESSLETQMIQSSLIHASDVLDEEELLPLFFHRVDSYVMHDVSFPDIAMILCNVTEASSIHKFSSCQQAPSIRSIITADDKNKSSSFHENSFVILKPSYNSRREDESITLSRRHLNSLLNRRSYIRPPFFLRVAFSNEDERETHFIRGERADFVLAIKYTDYAIDSTRRICERQYSGTNLMQIADEEAQRTVEYSGNYGFIDGLNVESDICNLANFHFTLSKELLDEEDDESSRESFQALSHMYSLSTLVKKQSIFMRGENAQNLTATMAMAAAAMAAKSIKDTATKGGVASTPTTVKKLQKNTLDSNITDTINSDRINVPSSESINGEMRHRLTEKDCSIASVDLSLLHAFTTRVTNELVFSASTMGLFDSDVEDIENESCFNLTPNEFCLVDKRITEHSSHSGSHQTKKK